MNEDLNSLIRRVSDLEFKMNSHQHMDTDFTKKITGAVSGTYTPTFTNVTNLEGATAYSTNYVRLGDIVLVSGKADINPTATGDTEFGISLPIESNFTASEQCGGVFAEHDGDDSGTILADATLDRANIRFNAGSASNRTGTFIFLYRIF